MARASIVGWLRKRRRLARGPLAAGTRLSARLRSFLGMTSESFPAPHIVLHAPADWRERMSELGAASAIDEISNDDLLIDAPDAVETSVEELTVRPGPSAPRVTVPVNPPSETPRVRPEPVAPRRAAPSPVTREPRASSRVPASPSETRAAESPVDTAETPAEAVASPKLVETPAQASLEDAHTPARPPEAEPASAIQAPRVEVPVVARADQPTSPSAPPISAAPSELPTAQERVSSRAPKQAESAPTAPPTAAPSVLPARIESSAEPSRVARQVVPEVAAAPSADNVRHAAAPSETPPAPAVQEFTTPRAESVPPETQRVAATPTPTAEPVLPAPESPRVETPVPATIHADAMPDARPAQSEPQGQSPTPTEVAPPRPATPDAVRPNETRRSRRQPPARAAEAPKSPRVEAQAPPAPPSSDSQQTPSSDRTLGEWRKLLFEATSTSAKPGVPEAAPQQSSATQIRNKPASPAAAPPRPPATPRQPPTEPLRESTRRFLKPRVGIDPASVPIVRGEAADRLLGPDADAAAIGETVVLPSTHDERSPRTLGLIAHEMTHVAQRRQPAFVPPVARPSGTPRTPSAPAAAPSPHVTHRPASAEESLARQVERYVVSDAEEEVADAPAFVQSGDAFVREYSSPSGLAHATEGAEEWGGLPAPWEPLPVADFAPSPPTVAARAPEPAAFADTPVHFAEHGRSLDEPGQASAAAPAAAPPPHDAAPPPDLDALARRVYDVLKRRLAAERRREG